MGAKTRSRVPVTSPNQTTLPFPLQMNWEAKGPCWFTHGTWDELFVPRKAQIHPRWCTDTRHTLKV